MFISTEGIVVSMCLVHRFPPCFGNGKSGFMPRKLTKPDDPEQSKRFIEAAEEVGAHDKDALEDALSKIGSLKERPSRPTRTTKGEP